MSRALPLHLGDARNILRGCLDLVAGTAEHLAIVQRGFTADPVRDYVIKVKATVRQADFARFAAAIRAQGSRSHDRSGKLSAAHAAAPFEMPKRLSTQSITACFACWNSARFMRSAPRIFMLRAVRDTIAGPTTEMNVLSSA